MSRFAIVALGWVLTACHGPEAPRSQADSRHATAPQSVSQVATPFQPQLVSYDGKGLGTKVRLVAYTSPTHDEAAVRAAFGTALQEMERLDALLSSWRPDSDVANVNAAAGQFVTVAPETAHLIERSLWIGRISDGAFDITFQSMSGLWRFGDAAEATPHVPGPAAVAEARALVDYRRVELDEPHRRVRIGAGQQIGLGGVAKGYVVDLMVGKLTAAGLTGFLVQAGGDLYASGSKPDGTAWESGIQEPRLPPGESFAKIQLRDQAFSTAGDYARAYHADGKRYHHIIDPRTGYPATASRSVTVLAPTALLADLIDDAVFIIGPERGLALVDSLPDVGAVIVDGKNQLWVSKTLRSKLKIARLPADGD